MLILCTACAELERTAALGTAAGAAVQERVGSAVKNGKAQALRDRCQVSARSLNVTTHHCVTYGTCPMGHHDGHMVHLKI